MTGRHECENDEFEVDFSKEIPFVHKPELYGDRGEVTHFWAMARFKDGGFHWDYMTRAEVEAIRDASPGWKSAVQYAKRDENGEIIEINSPWFSHFIEMGKKTGIRRISKFLPMSVQRAAAYDELADAGKPVAINDYGEVIIDENGEVIENESGEPTKGKSKLDEFGGAGKRGRKKNAEAKGQPAPQEADSQEAASPTIEDWLEDFAGVPTIEGLDHKFAQASEQFKADPAALAQLNLARNECKKSLTPAAEEVTPLQPGSSKKLFQQTQQQQPTAA